MGKISPSQISHTNREPALSLEMIQLMRLQLVFDHYGRFSVDYSEKLTGNFRVEGQRSKVENRNNWFRTPSLFT